MQASILILLLLESINLLVEGLQKFIVFSIIQRFKLTKIFTIMSLTNHCMGSHYESGFSFGHQGIYH